MNRHDDTQTTLIHPTDWEGYLRYATHERGEDWRPPFVSVPIAKMEKAADYLTPHRLGLFLLYVCAYTRAPLLDPEKGPRSARDFVHAPGTMYRRLGQKVTHKDVDSWEKAGLVTISTVGRRSAVGRPSDGVRTRAERGLGPGLGGVLDQDSDSAPDDREREADDHFTLSPVGLTDWSGGR